MVAQKSHVPNVYMKKVLSKGEEHEKDIASTATMSSKIASNIIESTMEENVTLIEKYSW